MKKSIIPLILNISALSINIILPLTIIVSIILVSAYSRNEYQKIFTKHHSFNSLVISLICFVLLRFISLSLPLKELYPLFVNSFFSLVGLINFYIIIKHELSVKAFRIS